MVRIEGLKLAPGQDEQLLRGKAARLLRVPEGDILSLQVLRRAIDAREELHFVYTAAVTLRQEKAALRRVRDRRVTPYAPEVYRLPETLAAPETPPVVIGAGPGGLFAALVLARCGLRPIVLERGQDAVTRQRDVASFWRTGVLDPESNVQFGEGGAGAFSDGKLNTGTRDIRHRWILEQLVSCGAPESILVDAKPHVGTDMLHVTLVNLRRQLLDLGAQVRFGHRVTGLRVRDGALEGLEVSSPEGGYVLPARQAVLALGHSARDTFEMLHTAGVRMEQKPFAVGVRIEHRQADMDAAQYRRFAGHPCLPAAGYKLSCHPENGRSAFSFCVCPGGQVVAAASEEGRVVTNGMSEYARDRENINGGLFTYPALMAADILLYQPDYVPVGSDQKQHVELCRDVATRFNNIYGDVFKIPEPYIPKVGARVMSLVSPENKMSKSDKDPNGTVYLLDQPDVIMRKFKKAVTDSDTERCVRYDLANKPGVSNLMSIYSACTGKTFEAIEAEFEGQGYGAFKPAVGEAVVETLRPIREESERLLKDKAYLETVYKAGAEKASYIANKTLRKVYKKVGFVAK